MSANRLTTGDETVEAGSVVETLHGSDSIHVMTRPPMKGLAAVEEKNSRQEALRTRTSANIRV